jgi:DNA modification methylase
VVDPFAGWGGTLVSAVAAGRKAIGAELERDAYSKAVAALRETETARRAA